MDTISFPEDLPVERQVIDIPEKDKTCPKTGKELTKIVEEVTSKLAHRSGNYFIKQIVRPKYAVLLKNYTQHFLACWIIMLLKAPCDL
ncbi:MAG: hypothetical protein LW832_04390 [Parachlamydia sp.]|nr:hypothetical protein [Parachlamydia sp.]